VRPGCGVGTSGDRTDERACTRGRSGCQQDITILNCLRGTSPLTVYNSEPTMPHKTKPHRPVTNKLLRMLPEKDFNRLLPHLQSVDLSDLKVLHQPHTPMRYVHFPNDAVVSLIALIEGGSTAEVGVVSSEGIVGVSGLLGPNTNPYRAIVQVPGSAWRMSLTVLKAEFRTSPAIQDIIHRYLHALITQIAQSAVCNRFHTIDQRLARWLLGSQDRVGKDSFHYTHDFLARMLGTDRSSVTLGVGSLRRAGLISNQRGRVTIVDRKGLEKVSCECFFITKAEFEDFAGPP
jgi:CRP-like cAMP-binding protein